VSDTQPVFALADGDGLVCDGHGALHQYGGWVIEGVGTRLTVAEVIAKVPDRPGEVRAATVACIRQLAVADSIDLLQGARMLAQELKAVDDPRGLEVLAEVEADHRPGQATFVLPTTVRRGDRARILEPLSLEQRGGKIPMPGAEPTGTTGDGVPKYRVKDLGYDPDANIRAGSAGPELRGAYTTVQPGTPCEILDIDEVAGRCWIAVDCLHSGPLHPHQLVGWAALDQLRFR